jgi:hypothetical protein
VPADGSDTEARQKALQDLIEAVHAADLEDEAAAEQLHHLDRRSSWDASPKYAELGAPHQLERPLHLELRFPGRTDLPPLNVDVLEYFDGGRRFSVTLPPDLEVRDGEAAEVRLPGPASDASSPVDCRLTRVEPGSLVKVALLELAPEGHG